VPIPQGGEVNNSNGGTISKKDELVSPNDAGERHSIRPIKRGIGEKEAYLYSKEQKRIR